MATLLTLVPKQKALTSNTAIIIPGRHEVNYADLRASTLHFRDILRNYYGVKVGDVVGLSLINSLEFVVAFLATGTARRVFRLNIPTRNPLFVK